MSWTTSVADMRKELSDGDTDKYSFRKKVFGAVDGTNATFKTFEFRRVSNFTTAAAPLGVYVNGALVTTASDSPATGDFTLTSAPAVGSLVEASYYSQWFLDAELTTFILNATNWLGLSTDPTLVPDGLRSAVIKFAASEAYLKMSMRWKQSLGDQYKVEDAPNGKQNRPLDPYQDLYKATRADALQIRDNYYTRQGRALQPLFSNIRGNVRDLP